MLHVERSNRTERLLDGLAERVMQPNDAPLAPAWVVVQGPGMERWVAQSIARRHGVCANVDFLFPRALLDRVFECRPGLAPNPAWSPERLTWSIARRLAECAGEPDFAPVARHLERVDGDWRLVQLAARVAELVDRYVTFRPEWIRDWSAGGALPEDPEVRWQARLVRELAAELGPGHFADRAVALVEAAAGRGADADRDALRAALADALPERVEVFAVSTLPPLYLSVLDAVAGLRDVHLSVLSPSRGWWADLWREVRDADRSPDAEPGDGLFAATPVTPAARLLAGLGRLGGDFQLCLEALESSDGGTDRFASPIEAEASATLLACLQADLLDLDEGEAADPAAKRVLAPHDPSIRVHLCHGPRRELEVVESALRDAFESDPSLLPEDVIVMAPHIDEIAPDIEAVFGVIEDETQAIPHRIADRGALRRSRVAETFLALLELLTSRMTRGELLDWLALPPARRQVDLDEEAIEHLSEWAERAGIRFGLDGGHREALGLGPGDAHTWQAGLRRLALAHAVGASAEVFEGLAPQPLDAFSERSVLGALGEVVEALRDARARVARPAPIEAWCDWLTGLLARFVAQSDDDAHEHTAIREALAELAEGARASGFDRAVPFEAVRERIVAAVRASPAPQAFLAGGVTFCELVPLRAIPFRVVVILGMSDGAFPRGGPPPGFDRMARAPRPGDRSARVDDRYLFLEALLSARDRLIVTVPGLDVRDGSGLPPSIVVTELLDAIDASFVLEDGAAPSKALVVTHPLQAFSARYFVGDAAPGLVGRDAEAFAAALARRAALDAGGGSVRRLLDRIEPEPPLADGPPTLRLEELIERVLRATRFFARERLRLRLPRDGEVVSELDPATIEPLDQYALGSALLEDLVRGEPLAAGFDRMLARAAVPPEPGGRFAVRALAREVAEVARIADARRKADPLPDVDATIELGVDGLGACRLEGRLDRLTRDGRVSFAFSRLAGRTEAEAWIRHLFLCAAAEEGHSVVPRSVFVGRSERKGKLEHVVRFEAVPEAKQALARLFAWAWNAQDAPLPLFVKASRKYASLRKDPDQAWRQANQTYHGGESAAFSRPESEEDPEDAVLWEGVSPLERDAELPLDHRFEDVAEDFFAPMLDAREESRE